MTRKLKVLIAINLILLAGIFLSLQWEQKSTTLETSTALFSLTDTIGIDRVTIGKNEFVKEGPITWTINGEYQANPDRMNSLIAIMQRIEVKRPVSSSLLPGVQDAFQEKGIALNVYANDELRSSYTITASSGESYAYKDGSKPFNIYIPGYVIDLYDFFSADPQEWRDKHILYTSWRTLKNLEVRYPGDAANSFRIYFDSTFYAVAGVQKLDSAKVYRYIQQYQDFEIERFLPQATSLRDSLLEITPACQIILSDMYPERDNELKIYPGKDGFYGISSRTDEAVLMSPRMLRSFLLRKEEFVRQTQQ